MKKMLLGLTVMSLVSTAAADQVGLFLTGVQYQQDTGSRYSIGYNGQVFGGYDYLIPIVGDFSIVSPYYGFGASAGFGNGNVDIRPNALAGLNLNIIPRFTPYAEINVGPDVYFGSSSGVYVSFGTRLGINYRF